MADVDQTAEMRIRYLAEAIETASPATRLTMLWDRMQLDLTRARKGFEASDLEEVNAGLVHAQEILLVLRDTMRVDAWEGAARVVALYDHLQHELLKANVDKDSGRAAAASALVDELANAWRIAAAEGNSARVEETSGAVG